MELSNLIKKSLDYYDKQNEKYKDYIENVTIYFDENNNEITIESNTNSAIEKITKKYEVLGIFNNQTKIWVWSWLFPYLTFNQTTLSRQLLDYGLKLEPLTNTIEHYYIKSQLVNSRFIIEDNIELDLNLSLASYLLKDNYLFIIPYIIYLNNEKTKYHTVYYLVK